jgi:hypothetical protein
LLNQIASSANRAVASSSAVSSAFASATFPVAANAAPRAKWRIARLAGR